jgi:hypothetical protein
MALQHLRSSTADKRPTPGAMSDGQLALNTNLVSPGLFFKDSNGDSVKIGPVHVGTTAPNVTPGAGGQAGNSKGEQWLDTSSSRYVFKIWDGTAWRSEDGEFVNASGDTMTGALVMDNQQQVRFRETTANGTNFIAIEAPASVTADRTLTLPDVTGTIVSTGDTGSVTSTMILDGTILNADINASAAIVDTKLDTIATAGKVSNSATTATDANTASAIVARSAAGNFNITSINNGPLAGMRNAIINGGMLIDQRNGGAGQVITTAGAYTVDRWICVPIGASVTGQRVTRTTVNQFGYQITGAAGVTSTVFLQRIEAASCASLANTTVTLSALLSNTVLTTVNWELLYPSATDNFATNTSIASGSWTVTSSDAIYTAQISIPDAATTGLQLNLSVGAQTSGTWIVSRVQLEPGTVATPFERRPIGTELALCQRYYEEVGAFLTGMAGNPVYIDCQVPFTQKRANATVSQISGRTARIRVLTGVGDFTSSNPALASATVGSTQVWTQVLNFSGMLANYPVTGRGSGDNFIAVNAEL